MHVSAHFKAMYDVHVCMVCAWNKFQVLNHFCTYMYNMVLLLSQGEWSEEELTTLREAFQSQDDWREAVREVSVYFPERGIRDLTQQLRTLGLIPSKNKSILTLFLYIASILLKVNDVCVSF